MLDPGLGKGDVKMNTSLSSPLRSLQPVLGPGAQLVTPMGEYQGHRGRGDVLSNGNLERHPQGDDACYDFRSMNRSFLMNES